MVEDVLDRLALVRAGLPAGRVAADGGWKRHRRPSPFQGSANASEAEETGTVAEREALGYVMDAEDLFGAGCGAGRRVQRWLSLLPVSYCHWARTVRGAQVASGGGHGSSPASAFHKEWLLQQERQELQQEEDQLQHMGEVGTACLSPQMAANVASIGEGQQSSLGSQGGGGDDLASSRSREGLNIIAGLPGWELPQHCQRGVQPLPLLPPLIHGARTGNGGP